MEMKRSYKIAVAGIGYVGLSNAILLAQKNEVYVVDVIPQKVDLINNKKILIVDDSPEAIEVLGNALPRQYKRQVALSGEKAIKLLESSEELPDLILLDVMMPGMDGYEVCRHLKKNERLKDIPVIYLSALTGTTDKVKAFEQGGVDYIEKPFQ